MAAPGTTHRPAPTRPDDAPASEPPPTCAACGRGGRAWDDDDVAAYLGISRRRLVELLGEDLTFPKPRRVGRLRRWDPAAIPAWVAGPSVDQQVGGRRAGRRGTSQRV